VNPIDRRPASPPALAPPSPVESIERVSLDLVTTLDSHGLPSANVLVPVEERHRLFRNLGDVVQMLDVEARKHAVYISKCVAACAVGLFDAALNYLWDETVANLRRKVERFDLEYFFDSTIADANRRKSLQTADDLVRLDDWELIKGCHTIGILSDIGHKHLDYIRDMRNWASAAHPNQNQVSGLQLVTWLETSIKEVFAKEPEGPAIAVKQLLDNVRKSVLTPPDAIPINASIALLPPALAASLLRAFVGMYADPNMGASTKNNIRLLAKAVWAQVPEDARQNVGLRYATLEVNGDTDRKGAVRAFLQHVDALSYLPPNTLAVEFEQRVDNLEAAHYGMNNFHNEPAHARALAALVPATGAVPDAVRLKYVKTVVLCRIGNAYGVSWEAQPSYEQLTDRFQEPEIAAFGRLISDGTIQNRLMHSSCGLRFQQLAVTLRARTANQHLLRVLDVIIKATTAQLWSIARQTETTQALAALQAAGL
jgi:hypothetical protein